MALKKRIAWILLWAAGLACAQTAVEPDAAKMKTDWERSQRILKDWANLGRYATDNSTVTAPANGEERIVG